MNHSRIKTCAACASVGPLLTASALAGPSFMGLGFLPGGAHFTVASDISADGSTVIGAGATANGTQAFRWTWHEGFSRLGELPDGFAESVATGVSEDGSTIVGFGLTIDSNSGGRHQAYRWTLDGGILDIGNPTDELSFDIAMGVSGDGSTIIGYQSAGDSTESYRRTTSGERHLLGHLPEGSRSYASAISADATTIVGDSTSANGIMAFRWTESDGMISLGDLPGGLHWSSASDVSADGSVIVGGGHSDQGSEAFRWSEAEGMVGLGDLPGGADLPGGDFSSSAYAVSADGTIVLGSSNSEIGPEAFIWTQQNGMRSLADVLAHDYDLDLTGWVLQEAHGISADNSTIVGGGLNPDGAFEAFIVRIPSPGAAALLTLGGLTIARRRR